MAELPNYARPPVIEVAIGTQFAPMADFLAAHVGRYWSTFAESFGRVEERGPIIHFIEAIEEAQRPPGFQISTGPELPRTWFIDKTGGQVIQVQRDRYLYNWRKVKEEDQYPRFHTVRDNFISHWEGFLSFLEEEHLPPPQLDQLELTYVNHVPSGQAWHDLSDLGSLVTCFDWRTRTGFLPVPENVGLSMHFRLPDRLGRLHVELAPVLKQPESAPALRLSLTVRGRPAEKITTESMKGWFELAREWIVKGFADLTQAETDKLWGKKT